MLAVTYYENAPSRFHHVIGDRVEAVDAQDARDLNEQPMQQPEVASCDPLDCGDRLGVVEVGLVQSEPEFAPSSRQHESQLLVL